MQHDRTIATQVPPGRLAATRIFAASFSTLLAALLLAAPAVASTSPAAASEGQAAAGAIPVEVVRVGEQFQLLRGGEPYVIKGAGLESGDIAELAAHGGNSFRTWRSDIYDSSGRHILDLAWQHGLTVSLCLNIARERHGFDYDDPAAVAAQLEFARGEVMKYKDHPALLTWIIGNEPNHGMSNPRVFNAINEISQMIQEVDGNHPTTTALAGFNPTLAEHIETRAPDLDFVSIQWYGDLVKLPRTLRELNYDQPYFVTEWGAVGHWEIAHTTWGAPIEPNSTVKAANYLHSYEVAIAPDPHRMIGNYVFLWGQKQERTPTWYGMFLEDGSATEAVDVMHYIWNGEWPQNRAPQIHRLVLDEQIAGQTGTLIPDQRLPAAVVASDPDGDALTYRWVLMHESQATQEGGDPEEIPASLDGLVEPGEGGQATLITPAESGAYRLFVYVYDGQGHAGHANIPFLVR